MKKAKQRNEGLQKAADMIEHIKVGMFTTLDDEGHIRSRPMHAVEVDADGAIWFFVKAHSRKTHHLQNVNLTFTDPGDADFLSITGSAELVVDRARIDALWGPFAKPWFHGGKEDPEVALLKVTISSADAWDVTDSTMVRLIAMGVAAVTGHPNATLKGEHDRISNPMRH
jgi:general stress protein 26